MKKLWRSAVCAVAKERFVIADQELATYFRSEHLVVLSDVSYWADHYTELLDWCKQYNCKDVGMTIEIPDSKTLTLFCLKWQ